MRGRQPALPDNRPKDWTRLVRRKDFGTCQFQYFEFYSPDGSNSNDVFSVISGTGSNELGLYCLPPEIHAAVGKDVFGGYEMKQAVNEKPELAKYRHLFATS